MFISRVEIPWEAARNPYELHRQVWRLFPGEEHESRQTGEQERQGFLFRVEERQVGSPSKLLVQSRRAPIHIHGIRLVGSREIRPTPHEGQQLAFLLTANPVKTIADADLNAKPGKRSGTCRVPLISDEERREWLIRKLGDAAAVEDVAVAPHAPMYFRKGKGAGKLVTCTFQGIFRVREPAALRRMLENGVGPAKGFGCGLLLVRRTD